MTPALPTLRTVANHVEKDVGTWTRGKKHTTPSPNADIEELQREYTRNKIHRQVKGRKVRRVKDKIVDYISKGVDELVRGLKSSKIWNWFSTRPRGVPRTTSQTWPKDLDSGSEEPLRDVEVLELVSCDDDFERDPELEGEAVATEGEDVDREDPEWQDLDDIDWGYFVANYM